MDKPLCVRRAPVAPSLLTLDGCGALTAAKLAGETADIRRFKGPNAFARHNGTVPIPVRSGNSDRQRLNRGGSRQINAAIHRIAITQFRSPGPAKEAYEQLTKAGKTKRDALRIIRRQVSNIVYQQMLEDSQIDRSAGLALAG